MRKKNAETLKWEGGKRKAEIGRQRAEVGQNL
jgi:hypothetical protein